MKANKLKVLGLVAFVLALGACGLEQQGARSPSASAAAASGPAKVRPRPNKVILGYSYTGNDAKWAPADYDYSELTHITRSFLLFQEDGTMTDGGIFDPKLSELAKKNGVKLLAAVGGWAGGQFDWTWYKVARDPKARAKLFDNLDVDAIMKSMLETYKVPAVKVLLGVPFYGKQFSTDKMGQPVAAGAIHPGEGIDYSQAAQLEASGDYKKLWDNGAHISYLERISGGHTARYGDDKAITEIHANPRANGPPAGLSSA